MKRFRVIANNEVAEYKKLDTAYRKAAEFKYYKGYREVKIEDKLICRIIIIL